jgi:hypothetical protein
MRNSPILEQHLSELCSQKELEIRTENNPYLEVSYKGTGKLISPKWNVKIYTSGSVVCNDEYTLKKILDGTLKPANNLKVIQIDDAGCGFPLCGTMVGVTDGFEIWTDTIDVSFFQSPKFEEKTYLQEFARKGIQVLALANADPKTHRIEICTGFINTCLRDRLRDMGYDVRVTEIKGLLQDRLEQLFKEHVAKETGKDLAYDPKEIRKENLGRNYYQVLNWGKVNTPHLLKSGWGSIKYAH